MIENFGNDSSKGLTLVMEKHGTGDQKPHGSWAHGVSPRVAADIQRFTREWGGLSISMVDGHLPDKGYMVAKPPKFSHIVDAADFFDPIKGPKILSAYMIKNKADLGAGSKNYLGTWLNKGKIYLDVSQNIMSRSKATKLGADRNQKKIWDVVNKLEIDTGGTGEVQKGNQGGGIARYFKDDGRGNRSVRPENLGEVRRKQVIYFSPGLKPVLKHSGGDAHGGTDDQSSHGNWATQGYTASESEAIHAMEGVGPTLDDFNNLESLGATPEYSDLIDFVNNDRGFYEEAIDGIDEQVAEALKRNQEISPNHTFTAQEKMSLYEYVQDRMIQDYVDLDAENLTELWSNLNGGGEFDEDEMLDKLNEVYAFESTGTNPSGDTYTLNASFKRISISDEGNLEAAGTVKDSKTNDDVGQIARTFYRNSDGGWNVEHDFFKIYDLEHRGTGFGKQYIDRMENWYRAVGIETITVGTAWDGARHWARAGYDWNPGEMETNVEQLISRVTNLQTFAIGTQNRTDFDSLMGRMIENYAPGTNDDAGAGMSSDYRVKSFKSEGFPLPADFANIGIDRKTTMDNSVNWAGKDLTDNLHMKYMKRMTAEGSSLLEGPIDRDGDGLVYDGTAREKPAPNK